MPNFQHPAVAAEAERWKRHACCSTTLLPAIRVLRCRSSPPRDLEDWKRQSVCARRAVNRSRHVRFWAPCPRPWPAAGSPIPRLIAGLLDAASFPLYQLAYLIYVLHEISDLHTANMSAGFGGLPDPRLARFVECAARPVSAIWSMEIMLGCQSSTEKAHMFRRGTKPTSRSCAKRPSRPSNTRTSKLAQFREFGAQPIWDVMGCGSRKPKAVPARSSVQLILDTAEEARN